MPFLELVPGTLQQSLLLLVLEASIVAALQSKFIVCVMRNTCTQQMVPSQYEDHRYGAISQTKEAFLKSNLNWNVSSKMLWMGRLREIRQAGSVPWIPFPSVKRCQLGNAPKPKQRKKLWGDQLGSNPSSEVPLVEESCSIYTRWISRALTLTLKMTEY